MPNSNFGNIQYKASNGLIKLDELEGIVECFVSGIGNKDSVGDICATGAFAKSLQRRKPRVVWGHNWNDPIGKVLEIYEVPASDQRLPMKMKMAGIGGLYAKVQFNLQSEKGKEAFANVAFFGEEQEWSIGYKTLRAQYDDNLQANVLYEVELYEVSPVLHGANQLTGTISVKSDEEKMHGMMPMVIGAPTAPTPRRDGIFDEGMSQSISGPQLAGVVAELSRRAGGPVMVVNATENSVVFVKPGKGKFRIGYHFTGSEYMFGKPELIQAEQPKPLVQSGPSPMPGITGKPSTNNPAMAMPVAMKPVDGGMVMVPLAPVEYEGSDKNKEPKLGAEESELAESLVRIARKYGKFDEDGDGIWAGYYPPAENKVKDIGVKCSNCVLYLGEGKCKILDFKVEDEAKCRFAIIPDGVVVGFGKKEYSDILDDEEIKMIEDIEAKYPGEFILGTFRNLVKKRRKKRKSYKTLEEWGVEELELEEKGLDPFLAHEYSYVIPVNPEDAFYFKSIIDPVLDYHRIDTAVNEYGIVINSPLSQESKDAISNATASAYAFLKKKIASEYIEEKALGRRIAGRAIDRPSIGGKKRRGGRGMGIPSGDLDPRTRRDSNLDGTLFDNVPGWEQPDPTPGGPGSINNPKPSKRQLADAKKPDGKEKLSSGKRNERRHADRSADMEKQFPNAEENQKRADHEAIAKAWEDQGLGWEEVPRYNADKNLSSDYLRGREIGVNQARVMWQGDSVRKRPEKFNEKQKASQEYSNWYSSFAKSVSAYLDAHSRDDSDNWDGIESALRAEVKSKYPDTQDWAKEDIATLNEYLNDIGLLDGVQKPAPKKGRDSLSSGKKNPTRKKKPKTFSEMMEESDRLEAEGKPIESMFDDGWEKTENGFEMDAPDIDGMYRINSEGKGKYSVTRFTDIYRDGGQNALDEDIDRTFSSPSAAKKWAERDYDKIIESMVRDEEYMQDPSRLSSGGRLGAAPDDAEYGRELAAQRARDRAAGRNATNPIGRGGDAGDGERLSSGKSPEYLKGREEGSKQIRAMWRGDSTNQRPYKFDEKNNASLSYQEWYGNVIPRAGAFLEASRDDNSELYNGMEDAIHEFMNSRSPDATNFRSVDMDAPGGLYDMMRRWGFDPSSPVPLRKQKDKDKRSSSRLSSGRKLTDREEMDTADESLRSFLNEFDGWDDEEWEFGNQLDSAVERWASSNEDMPWINTSVEEMIDEMDADESIEGQNKLAFLKNLQQSLFDAQDRARMSDDERSRDRLERSVRRSQSDFDEGGILSSGNRFSSETERLAAWKPVLRDLRSLKDRVNGNEINDGLIGVGDMDVKPGSDFFRGRQRAYMGLMDELDEIIANAQEEGNLDLEGPTEKSRARFERLVNTGDWVQARFHMEGEIASVREKRSDPVDDGRLSSGRTGSDRRTPMDDREKELFKNNAAIIEILDDMLPKNESWDDWVDNEFRDADGTDQEKHDSVYGPTTDQELIDFAKQSDEPRSDASDQEYFESIYETASPIDKLQYVAEYYQPLGARYGSVEHQEAFQRELSNRGLNSRLSSGRKEALNEAMSKDSKPASFDGYGGDMDADFPTGGWDDSGPFSDEYIVDLDTVSSANGTDFVGNTVTLNDGRRGVIVDGSDFEIELRESEYSSRKDTPTPIAGGIDIVITHDENGNLLDTPEYLNDGYEISFDTDNGTGFLIADEDMWKKQNDKENEGFTLIQIDDNKVDDDIAYDLAEEKLIAMQPARDAARAKEILSKLNYRGFSDEYKSKLRRELGQIRQRQFANSESRGLSSGRRGGRRGESLYTPGEDPEATIRKDQIWELGEIGHTDMEAERILDHWMDADGETKDEYINEYGAGGERFVQDVAYAASQLYQDYLETQYDNRQARNLSSGKRKNQEELGISDREIFERRMGGESLMDTASALGMTREDVRQAEMRHMARERGTLNSPDFDEIESYREDQDRMAAEEAAELSMNESIYDRRMGGESLADTAKALGMTREQVRRREQKHMQLLRDRDKEAKAWIARQGGDVPGSGEKKYVSPLEDMDSGQRLSSGKLDEVYRSVQEKLIEQIEKIQETGDGKWEFPWHKTSLPKNVTNNNRPYSGINSVMLMFKQDAMNYDMPLWAGFNQWKNLGGTVRKGEKGTLILIPTIVPKKKDADGNEIRGSGGVFFKTGYVFNIDQIDGIDKEQFRVPELPEEQRVAELEQALSEVGAVVNSGGDRAFYRPSTDEIHLPPFSAFKSREGYYGVFAHELMHWTGHPSRLNRDHLGEFGSPEYAQEELVAEIASAFFMAAHGLTPEPREDHAQYLAGWLKKLKSDPDAMKKAFGEAQKAHDYAISQSPSMSKKLGKKVAEAGVLPGNGDAGYGDIGPSLSSGARDKYVKNPEGTVRTLADEAGAFGDELLTRFKMVRGLRDGDRHLFEGRADLGESNNSPNEWDITEGEDGKWSAALLRLEFGNGYTESDWAGVVSDEFDSPEDVAKWISDYESTRKAWVKKFKAETDFQTIASMLDEETSRRDAEYEDSIRILNERADRQQYARMIAEIDESRLEWSAEDWADEAADIQIELERENGRLSSGVRSRHDETPAEEIGTVSNALKRTDEAGSNSRYIASRLSQVPADKYDFDSIRKNGESVSFTYGGKPRTIYPTGMMAKKGGGIYVVGLDDDQGQYRSYSLHKIEGLVDGADAPYNPTQPGVPRGTPGTRTQRTRNVTSDRLSSGKVRPLDEVRAEIEEDAQYESMVVQRAFDGTLGRKDKRGYFATIPLEEHAEAVQSLERLVTLRNDLLRSLLDGKRMPARSSIFEVDKYAPVAEDELDLLMNIDDAVDSIHRELSRTEETFSELNNEIDDMKESISKLENAFRTSEGTRWKIRGPVNFESAMEKHIDSSDGDDKYAIRLMESDADSIIEALEEIDDAEDRFSRVTHEEQIAEIKELIDSAVRGDLTPQEFASKLSDLFYKNVNGLEGELSELLDTRTDFENNGVTTDREDITGNPKDVFSSNNLSNFDMVEGDVAEFSSGRRKRTQGSKRRPMSDADRQAFADGVRQRAATIPGKRRTGPSKDEFDNEKLSSGRLYFPSELNRNKVGRDLEDNVKIKFGRMSENNDRTPDGKWMLDASKLKQLLRDEDGNKLSNEESAKFLGISMRELEKMLQDGAGISEADAYTFIDQAFTGGSNPAAVAEVIEAVWGFDSAPYWYDRRRGNLLTRAEYDDYKDEGIDMDGELVPRDFDAVEKVVASEISKNLFPVSALAESLGVESDEDLTRAITFEVDGEQISPTAMQLKKWKKEGVPTAIIEQLVDRGVIPSAGDVFGEEGTKFDNSIRQFDLWKNVKDAIEKSGTKARYKELDEVIGAAKVLTRLRAFEEGREGKFSKNTGKALRYSDEEVQVIVDRLNKKYKLNETVESIKGGGSLSSGRQASRRISNSGQEAAEKLSSNRKNNGAPENITPRMQNELIAWAENARWSGFAQSVASQFKANGFLSPTQWTRLLQLHDNLQKRR